jgi:hypothetical protein
MFFPVFWTVYIPIVTIILAAAGEWLTHAGRQLRARAQLACSNRGRARAVPNREVRTSNVRGSGIRW